VPPEPELPHALIDPSALRVAKADQLGKFGACSSDIINGFGLENDNQYNEFQSDSSASDNTANAKNTNLKAIINNKLAE
jgi:hypothetical protein